MILKDKIALITGASRGIGRAVAELFEKEGAELILTAKQNMDLLKDFKHAKICKLDISRNEDINILIKEIISEFGRIDILVNNAAFFKQTNFEDISELELQEALDADFSGPFLLLQKVYSQMKIQNGGKIVNIASGAGKMGSSRAAHYAALKAALISLTKSLAKLGGKYNINVNSIAPGFIETDMIKDMLADKRQVIESWIPLGRVGKPSDVASAVLFLSSANSNYITGQTVCVDGGHCMV